MSTSSDPAPSPEPEPGQEPLPAASVRRSRGRGHHAAAARRKSTVNAAKWVLIVAVLQVLFGLVMGFNTAKEADQAMQNLATMEDDDTLEIEGEEMTVAETRKLVQREKLQAFVFPIGLGVVFLALWFWARVSPLPALSSALVLFVSVHLLEAVVDPTSLARGIILKVFVIGGLIKGIKSALEQRAIDAHAEAEPAE